MKGVDFMSIELHFNITNGPSIHRLIDAFKYAYDRENPHKATFSMLEEETGKKNEPVTRKVTITTLEHEDGSGNSFLFKGYMGILPYESRFSTVYKVSGWYNTKTNKGYIKAEA